MSWQIVEVDENRKFIKIYLNQYKKRNVPGNNDNKFTKHKTSSQWCWRWAHWNQSSDNALRLHIPTQSTPPEKHLQLLPDDTKIFPRQQQNRENKKHFSMVRLMYIWKNQRALHPFTSSIWFYWVYAKFANLPRNPSNVLPKIELNCEQETCSLL